MYWLELPKISGKAKIDASEASGATVAAFMPGVFTANVRAGVVISLCQKFTSQRATLVYEDPSKAFKSQENFVDTMFAFSTALAIRYLITFVERYAHEGVEGFAFD